MTRDRCPVCEKFMVPPAGSKGSEVLIVGEAPGPDEVISGTPFQDDYGDILKKEFMRHNMRLRDFRRTHLWKHAEPSTKADHYEQCEAHHLELLLEEIKDAKYLMMMGSAISQRFLDVNVGDVAGLNITDSPFLHNKIQVCVWVPTIASATHSPVGEFRLAIEKFATLIGE